MRSFLRQLQYLVIIILLPVSALGQSIFGEEPPDADEVFRITVVREAGEALKLHWAISDGNYLYRDSIEAKLDDKPLPLQTPAGDRKDDPNFGTVEVYHKSLDVVVKAPFTGTLTVTYRGCAQAGICYPPISKSIDLATLSVTPMPPTASEDAAVVSTAASTDNEAASALNGSALTMAATFLSLGMLLAFTPCVFPMIPILSAMLAGTGARLSAARGFILSAAYVAAMAAAYGLVGLVAGMSGANLQAILQTPWALAISAALFAILALSMFGVFNLALPSALAAKLQGQRSGGSVVGAAALGFGSALIVSPCVTPPLAAAVLYSMQSGDAWKGAVALFFLGLGMGLPLIAFGTFGPRFLPKSGVWLEQVRSAFGFVFLGVAVMLVTRLVSETASIALWGIVAIGLGVFVGAFDRMDSANPLTSRLKKMVGLVAAFYGAILIVGFAGGGTDPLRPLAFLGSSPSVELPASNPDHRITSSDAFDRAVALLGQTGKPILVSFTADWCTVCKSNEVVFASPGIRKLMADIPMIVADVTDQGNPERTLMTRFGIVGPPTMFIVDGNGAEQPGSRLVGPITPEEISKRLANAGA
ncbi:protein-disulfide reductase DsbD [Agrobacterium vitis]|uniref:Protein-disulfide reductase DsbD n=1 Tax=Agrobacterium vitis TaxID=373 RepID=A0ABD6G8F9_AGRVI|nr:protein-disulfide reductase DsbD [Agrobacterium vitis]MUO82281.1 protein-disulfide reductase DsbD [Agrobacterium vitis]MUO97657.1 protein-disulfide reductase DsbD [Agrobacterium vitis]MUP05580.1 protein-disulfide reductase DsbD [Agrobacterium vitis]MUZ81426.1 protein-disulfide reductase DsbD [Agrobacterium vitis]MVA95425.1 protein-disulfide reductase DsbD [Agrobacterium vitis]